MNNIWKRTLSLVVAMVMIIGMVPFNALAAEVEDAKVAEVQAMIDALVIPNEDDYAEESAYAAQIDALDKQLVAIDEAAAALSEEQIATLDTTNFFNAVAAVDAYRYSNVMTIAEGTEADPHIITIATDSINGVDLLARVKEFGGTSKRHFYANGTQFTKLGIGYVGNDTVTFGVGKYQIQGESSKLSFSGVTYTKTNLFWVEVVKQSADDAVVTMKEGTSFDVPVNFFYDLDAAEQNFVANVVAAACDTKEGYDPSKMVLQGYIDAIGIGWTNYAYALAGNGNGDSDTVRLVYDGTEIGQFTIRLMESRKAPTITFDASKLGSYDTSAQFVEGIKGALTATDSNGAVINPEYAVTITEGAFPGQVTFTAKVTNNGASWIAGGDTSFTATGVINTYTITWDAGEGTFANGSNTATTTVAYGVMPTAPAENPTRTDGVEFTGWGDVKVVDGNATYTATWANDKNSNGVDDELETATIQVNVTGNGTVALTGGILTDNGNGTYTVIYDSTVEGGNVITVTATPNDTVSTDGSVDYVVSAPATVTVADGETATVDAEFATKSITVPESGTIYRAGNLTDAYDKLNGLKADILAAANLTDDAANYTVYMVTRAGTYNVESTNGLEKTAMAAAMTVGESQSFKIETVAEPKVSDTISIMVAESRLILTITASQETIEFSGKTEVADIQETVKDLFTITTTNPVNGETVNVNVSDSYITWSPAYAWPADGQTGTFTVTAKVNSIADATYQNAPSASVTVTLTDTTILYTVTYLDGYSTENNVVAEYTIAEFLEMQTPEDPTRDYYTFAGWTPAVAETVTGDVTYTATWTANTDVNGNGIADETELYTVVYVLGNGLEDVTLADQAWGAATPSIDNPAVEGWNFKGWTPEVAATVSAPAEGNTITYTAIWTQNHVVKFVDRGVESFVEVENGNKVAEPDTPVWDKDHDFLGWYNGEEKYDFSALVTESLTLTAKWQEDVNHNDIDDSTEIHVHIQYLDGETVLKTFENVLVGLSTPTIEDPTKAGYKFVGWEPEVAETVSAPEESVDGIYGIAYFAQWVDDVNNNGVSDAEETITLEVIKAVEADAVTITGVTAIEGGYVYDSTGDKIITVKASPVVAKDSTGSYVSGITVNGTAAEIAYASDYTVTYSFTAVNGQAVAVSFAKAEFVYNDERLMNYYPGMKEVKNETVYNTIVASPALPGEYTIQYKAREAMSQTVDLKNLVGDNDILKQALETMKLDTITIDMPVLWQDVNVETDEGLIKDSVSLDQAVAENLTAEDIGELWNIFDEAVKANGGYISLTGLPAGYKAVESRIAELTDTIKNAAMYYQAHNFGYNPTDAETVEEIIKITYGNEKFYIEGESTINLKDLRAPSYLKGNNISVVYRDYTDEDLIDLIAPYVENAEGQKIDAVVTALDITDPYTFEGKVVSDTAYELTFKFAGDETYKPSEGTFTITVTKASAKYDAPNVNITYGTEYNMLADGNFTLGNKYGIPAEVAESMIQIVIGLNAADFAVDAEGNVTGLSGKIQLILPEELQSILNGILGITGGSAEDGVELSLNELLDVLDLIPDTSLDALNQILDAISGIADAGELKIVLGGALPKDTGAYLYGAVSTSSNYETAFDVAYILITPKAERVYLDWNFTETNGIFTYDLVKTVGLGASAYNDEAFTDKNDYATAKINNLIFGMVPAIGEDGNPTVELKLALYDAYGSNTDTIEQDLPIGGYTQLAFIGDFGNEMVYATPIVRAFVLAPSTVDVEIGDETDTNEATFTGAELPVDATVSYNGTGFEVDKQWLTVTYTGIQTNGKTYEPTTVAPTHAGAYVVTAIYMQYDGEQLIAVGGDVETLIIKPAQSTISVTGGKFEHDGQPHGVTVESSHADVTLISGYVSFDANKDGLGIEDVTGVINVDFPVWLDEILSEQFADAYANGVNTEDVLFKLDQHKDTLLEMGITQEMINSLTNLMKNLPNSVTIYFNDVSEYTAPGAYAYVGIVTDSDYIPSMDTGLVVIQKKGMILDMVDTTVTWNGEKHFIDVINPENSDYVTIIIDRENNIGNIILEDDLNDLLAIIEKSLGREIPKEIDVAELQTAIADALAQVETLENIPVDLTTILTQIRTALAQLPQTGTVYLNGEWLPTEIGEYEFYGASYSAEYATNLTEGVLEIVPVEVKVTVADNEKVYGEPDTDPAYEVKFFDHEGNEITEPTTGVEVTFIREEGEDVGFYTWTASVVLEDEEHFVVVEVTEDAQLEITPAELNITVENLSKTYGDADPDFEYEITGLVNGDTEADVNFAISRAEGEDVGVYPITATAESENYIITITEDAALTITPKAITVTVDDQTKTYGDADPENSYEVEGLVEGDTLTVTYSREEGEDVGTYTIDATAENSNYDITVVPGTLTIEPKAITADDVALVGELTYNAAEQTQAISVTEGITYEVTGNTGTDAGDYTLTVTGTGNYTGTVELPWTIAKKAVTVTVNDAEKIYGENDPAFTFTPEGLAGTDTLIVEFTREAGENVGSYAINATAEDSNYDITVIPGTLTVKAKEITVTVANASKTYGDADPTFTYTAEGLVGEDTLVVEFTREAGENVGTYAINAAATNGNYDITVVPGTLTIAQKAVTVTVNSAEKIYGNADPELTYSVDGLVEGDDLGVVITRAEGENVGEYAITATADNANYNVTIDDEAAKLTIKKATVTVTIKPQDVVIDDNDNLPAVDYTVDCDGVVSDEELGLKVYWNADKLDGELVEGSYYAFAEYNTSDNFDVIVEGAATAQEPTPPTGEKWPRLIVGEDVDYVCWNMQTGAYYTDLSDALEVNDGAEAETIQMLKDYTEKYVIIAPGTTLDLDDHTVTATFVVGLKGSFLTGKIQSGKNDTTYGKLVVNKDHVSLSSVAYFDGAYDVLPVYNPSKGYYQFSRMQVSTTGNKRGLRITDDTIEFQFMVMNSAYVKTLLFNDGIADNGLQFVVRLEWSNEDGTSYQNFVFKDQYVIRAYTEGGLDFLLTLVGYEALEINLDTLVVKGMVTTDCGVISNGIEFTK